MTLSVALNFGLSGITQMNQYNYMLVSYPIQSNEFRRAQVILYARISISKHLYTNRLT